jgi:hypothetical protein
VTAGGNGIFFTDVNNFIPTSIVSTGAFNLTAVGQIGAGFVTSTTGTSGTLSAGINNVAQNLEVDSTGSVLFTGSATNWNLNVGSSIGQVLIPNGSNIQVRGREVRC